MTKTTKNTVTKVKQFTLSISVTTENSRQIMRWMEKQDKLPLEKPSIPLK